MTWERCDVCYGSGRLDYLGATCNRCGGKGIEHPFPSGTSSSPCSNCWGTGKVSKSETCWACNGAGGFNVN